MQKDKGIKKDVKYLSTDKMYKVQNHKADKMKMFSLGLVLMSMLVGLISAIFIKNSVNFKQKRDALEYREQGKANYTVYLKDNDFYETKYLPSGMQYVANLINTINAKFNYEIHSDEDINYNYTYKIIGQLQITDPNDTNKVIYSKDYNLVDPVIVDNKTNNLVINVDANIDYAKFNGYVNSYKSQYGISASSKLVVTMYVNATGKYKKSVDTLDANNKLQITIPLSEQTIGIAINTDDIHKSEVLTAKAPLINNLPIFICGLSILGVAILILVVGLKLYREYVKRNIYTITVNKILKEYDRLIVNGSVTVDEASYANKVQPETFTEMVDAAQNLNAPILYYNVIPGEKCFFVIIKGDTLYKFRLTKAYLDRQELEKN